MTGEVHVSRADVTWFEHVPPTPRNPYGERITRRRVWVWVAPDGVERCFSTKREALDYAATWKESS